jgi:hypothetical protein
MMAVDGYMARNERRMNLYLYSGHNRDERNYRVISGALTMDDAALYYGDKEESELTGKASGKVLLRAGASRGLRG